VAGEVHGQKQRHQTMYDSQAFIMRHKDRCICILPQTVSTIHMSSTHPGATVRLHHSVQHLTIGPTQVDHVLQMLSTITTMHKARTDQKKCLAAEGLKL